MWYSLKSWKTHKNHNISFRRLSFFEWIIWFLGEKSPILNFSAEQLSKLKAQEGEEGVGELGGNFPCPLEEQGVNNFLPPALLLIQAQRLEERL